jgi:hypothetical protein
MKFFAMLYPYWNLLLPEKRESYLSCHKAAIFLACSVISDGVLVPEGVTAPESGFDVGNADGLDTSPSGSSMYALKKLRQFSFDGKKCPNSAVNLIMKVRTKT